MAFNRTWINDGSSGKRQANRYNGKTWPWPATEASCDVERRAPGSVAGPTRARIKSVAVTKNTPPPAESHDALIRKCKQLLGEVARVRRELDAVPKAPSALLPPNAAAVLERIPSPEDADSGERRLHLTMNGTRIFALERLVAHFGLSRRVVIERLIDWADDTLSRSLYDNEAAFNRYIDRDRNEK